MNLFEKVSQLQSDLKCNKSQYNGFGKYNYRSCEDITESIKPYLVKLGLVLNMNDEIKFVEGRFYVKSIATLINTEDGEQISSTGYAREEENKKGMDSSQVTGAASSYSRKYALNALLCLDDTKDADCTNKHGQETKSTETKSNTPRSNNKPSENKNTNSSMTLEEAKAMVMPAGKFKDKTLAEIHTENPGYIKFIANTSNDAKLKNAAIKILEVK